jgi:hypothetical protein
VSAIRRDTLPVFCTFGIANTSGVFQSYYQSSGYLNGSRSAIIWIGSVQLFFPFFLGAVPGPPYDRGYFRHLIYVIAVNYVVGW